MPGYATAGSTCIPATGYQDTGEASRVQAGTQGILNYWPGYKWTKGAYGYCAARNHTRFLGYEGGRQGNCHFCGEHRSVDSQGAANPSELSQS